VTGMSHSHCGFMRERHLKFINPLVRHLRRAGLERRRAHITTSDATTELTAHCRLCIELIETLFVAIIRLLWYIPGVLGWQSISVDLKMIRYMFCTS
jgi:hypothetical protein